MQVHVDLLGKRHSVFSITLILCSLLSGSVRADQVGIVLSAELESYQQALVGLKKRAKFSYSLLDPEILHTPEALIAQAKKQRLSVIVTIGTTAAVIARARDL